MSRGNPFMLKAFHGPEGDLSGSLDMSKYRPKHLGQAPDFQAICRSGEVMVGTVMGMSNIEVARCMANLGFDFCFVDMEHTPMSAATVKDIIQTIHSLSEGETPVIVRVPSFDHTYIGWVLDAGAAGIVVPHSETREQAEKVVAAARFPPLGHRSFPPFATLPGITDGVFPPKQQIFEIHNGHPAIIMQIESKKGCENAEEILGVPGVNATMIGSGDLCLDLGIQPGLDSAEPAYIKAVGQVFEAAKKHGDLPVFGFTFGQELISKKVEQGYRGLMVASDVTSLCFGQMAELISARKLVKKMEEDGKVPKPKAAAAESGNGGVNGNGSTNGH